MMVWERLFGRTREKPRQRQPLQGWTPAPAPAPGSPEQAQPERHYLEGADYLLPKDAEEDSRLDFQHHALFHALGTHYVAPLSPPLLTILDAGTGTGIWAEEMACLFPASLVVGVDLSASSFKQPVPENCLLRVGNVLTGLPFPDAFFSYTHQRLLAAGITAANWPRVVQELVRVTRQGGWLEMVEAAGLPENVGPATEQMQQFLVAVGRQMGFEGEIIKHLGDLLKQAGVERVETQPIPVPVGAWAGRVGSMMKQDMLAATNALRGRSCAQANISDSAFDQMVQAMAQEWETARPSCVFTAVYGKRAPQ